MRMKLTTVEYLDEYGRLCAVQFWSWMAAWRYASSVPVLVEVREH
jgi:hypothetical protein